MVSFRVKPGDFGKKSYTLAGRRGFVHRYADAGFKTKWTGYWSPPLKFFEYFTFRINGEHLNSSNSTEFILNPEDASHYFKLKDFDVVESVFVPDGVPGFVSELIVKNTSGEKRQVGIGLEAAVNIRTKADDQGTPNYAAAFHDVRRAVIVKDEKGRSAACGVARTDKKLSIEWDESSSHETRCPDSGQRCFLPGDYTVRLELRAGESASIPFIFAASESEEELFKSYDSLLAGWKKALAEKKQSMKKWLASSVVETPSEAINQAFSWASVSLNSMLHQSSLGTCMFAGYPWFLEFWGRDVFWSLFAMVDLGEYGVVKDCVRTMAKFQKKNMPCTVNLDGNVLYHGADVDPLFLYLMDYYKACSGDRSIGRELKASVDKSLASLRERNGFVLHQPHETWMDTVERKGTAIEIQALWAKALEARNPKLSGKLRKVLASSFWNSHDSFPFDAAGEKESSDALTINCAVPLMFRMLPEDKASVALDRINADFKTRWGVRTRAPQDEEYSPGTYHKGSAWGLATGWAAAANFANSRPSDGAELLETMAGELGRNGVGSMSECLDSETGELLGCTAQAGSAALFIHAVDRYLFGIAPDLPRKRLLLTPLMPHGWKRMARRGRVMGDNSMDFSIIDNGRLIISIEFEKKPGLECVLTLPPEVTEISVNGSRYKGHAASFTCRKKNRVVASIG